MGEFMKFVVLKKMGIRYVLKQTSQIIDILLLLGETLHDACLT